MFFWRISVFLKELDETMPTLAMATREMTECFRRGGASDLERIDRIFEGLADISIDYGLMEKSSKVALIPARFTWEDLGSWDSLKRAYATDRDGNVTKGDPILINTYDSVIYNEDDSNHVAMAVMGMRGVTVVGMKRRRSCMPH